MSIETSVFVRPSPCLLSGVAVMGLLAVSAGLLLVVEYADSLALVVMAMLLTGLSLVCAVVWIRHFSRGAGWRIDISAHGRLYLTHDGRPKEKNPSLGFAREEMLLMPGSTIWPAVMVLHLTSQGGQRVRLTILPDSTSKAAFKELMVACRWIATHNNRSAQRISALQTPKY